MSDIYPNEGRGRAVLGTLIAFGLIVGGWALGAQIKATRLGDRYVTVKGLVERTVKSDLAIWPITYKETGDELSGVSAKTEADKKIVLDFLAAQGVQPGEIELGVVRVIDTQANEYGGGNRAPRRYLVEQQITVRTGRVDQVAAATQKTMQLLQKGIVMKQSQPGSQLQIHRPQFHQAGHDYRSHAQRARRCRPVCVGLG